MKYRAAGSTGLQVSEIGFGCGGTAGLMLRGTFDEQVKAVARALELGINYYDEAPDYGDSLSETNLGAVLRELGARPILTTKVEVRESDLGDVAGHVERSVDASLRRLGVDYVDFVQVHNGPVSSRPELRGRDYRELSLEDYLGPNGALEGLLRVRSAGKARHLGFICRGDDGAEVRQLIDTGEFALINLVYTLLNPTAAGQAPPGLNTEPDFGGVIPYALEHGVGVAVYSPLASGVLSDGAIAGEQPHPLSGGPAQPSEQRRQQLRRAAALRFLSESQPHSLAQAAVRFILMQPGVTTVLGGFSSLPQLEEIAEASEQGPLPEEVISRVGAVWQANFGL